MTSYTATTDYTVLGVLLGLVTGVGFASPSVIDALPLAITPLSLITCTVTFGWILGAVATLFQSVQLNGLLS